MPTDCKTDSKLQDYRLLNVTRQSEHEQHDSSAYNYTKGRATLVPRSNAGTGRQWNIILHMN